MKFAIVVVLLALALGAQSSVVPLGGAVVVGGVPGSVAIQAAAVPLSVAAIPSPVQIVSPAVVPAPVVVAAAPASYVAKTRGAVHVAPLPGHINSAASVNLEPAPGTL